MPTRAGRNGAWVGGIVGLIVAFLAMAGVGALIDLPGWLGVNLAWFVLGGASIGRRRAEATMVARSPEGR